MIIEHNSHNTFFRSPFGAVQTNKEIALKLLVFDERLPENVILHIEGEEYKEELPMEYTGETTGHAIFEARITAPEKPMVLWYWFEIGAYGGVFYYGNNLKAKGGNGLVYDTVPRLKYQITVFKPGYKTPDWLKGGVIYQIFPDRFYNGNEDRSVYEKQGAILHNSWNELPYHSERQFGGEYLANDFFGGNIAGIIQKLDYLSELGVSVLYLNPIFEAFSNHRYDTANYETVDPVLGTNEDFIKLCHEAESRGIKIILDGVFSHTGSDSVYFNKTGRYSSVGAYQSKESPYYSWYRFENHPDKYDCWWGVKTLPNVNETEKSYLEYILNGENAVVKQWIRQGASGWRLDVADELPDAFLKEMRREVKKESEDAAIIGEVWEDASHKESYGVLKQYLLGEELDSVMNYPFRDAVIRFVCRKINGWDFNSCLLSLLENYPKQAVYAAMNLLSSHDVLRIRHAMAEAPDLTREEQAHYVLSDCQRSLGKQRQKLAVMLQMTFVGVPCIYYGDEAGMDGYEDPFNRQTFPWEYIDYELLEFYKTAISLRNKTNVLKKGEFRPISIDNDSYSFVRYIVDGFDAFGNKAENECLFVILNTNETLEREIRFDLRSFGITKLHDMFTEEVIDIDNGAGSVLVAPLGFKVYRCV